MKHLSDVEFVDLLDGRLPIERRDHLDACGACRLRAGALRAALEQVPPDPVAEPSPLFWDHFSARVAEAVRREPTPRAAWRVGVSGPLVRWSAVAATLVLFIVLSLSVIVPRDSSTPAAPEAPAIPAGTQAWLGDVDSDQAWAIVQSAADGLEWDEVEAVGIAAPPGSAEGVVAMEFTEEERLELARLIEDELRRTGS